MNIKIIMMVLASAGPSIKKHKKKAPEGAFFDM